MNARHRAFVVSWALAGAAAALMAIAAAEDPQTQPDQTTSGVTALALPGAPADGVALDYLAAERARNRIWIPAGGTGNTVVIDAKTLEMKTIEGFPTREMERNGRKRMVGPSSATIGDGFVYVGNRADSSICAIDATTLARAGCLTLEGSPDGIIFIPRTKEVWVTMPRDATIAILDVSQPGQPKLAGSIKLEGEPEGYALDDGRGLFYTNLEDKDRTLRIDVSARKVTAAWEPSCGASGPRGLAIEPKEQLLMVACTSHVEVIDAGKDGKILSNLDTGDGVDSFDYLPAARALYVAASGAATLTVAHLDEKGALERTASTATVKGARNAVVTDDGTAFIADGPEGKILVVRR